MKIVVLGAKGMLGHDLVNTFKNDELYPFDVEEIDITDKNIVNKRIKSINPQFVVNAAAYTDVDGCESNLDLAYSVNADGVRNIAESCKKNNCILVHISTDYVFDGNKNGYREDDNPNPINSYGKSKYLGEKYLQQTTKRYYLIRTSWLYGKNGKNFVNTILNLAKNKKEIEVVNDQKGNPTYSKDLSESIKNIINKKPALGIYHVTNSGVCTWFDFAKKIVEIKDLKVDIMPISSDKLKRDAKRPNFSVLINTKLPNSRSWELALKDFLNEK